MYRFFIKLVNHLFLFSLLLFLTSCSSHHSVSVENGINSLSGFHKVSPGETLYSIAWNYGKDYHELAKMNAISPPYKIKAGQKLRLFSVHKKISHTFSKPINISKKDTNQIWLWPLKGKVINYFHSKNGLNKGIDIIGKPRAIIKAAAKGKVVYSGNGLKGYGQLIIIKHQNNLLSAYGNNKKLFVREDDMVFAGQKIAEIGYSGKKTTLLHFEIRKNGKPMNPLLYLTMNK
ncbi:MAG: hypothetical protein LEGION0398_MBIBDBAK_01293 [Legionellaceae bacterium]